MKTLFEKTIDYLKEKVPNFIVANRGKIKMFTCPVCGKQTASMIPNTSFITCVNCSKSFGNLIDIVRIVESDKQGYSNDDIIDYLSVKYNLDIITESFTERALKYYEKNNFDLVPIQSNGKKPIEKEWTNREHKDINEWKRWLKNGINIGIKTGKISNVTILDLDTKIIPSELKIYLDNYEGLLQESTSGYHFVFQYEEGLPNRPIEIKEKFNLDIENNGGQVVFFPSKVEGISRKVLQFNGIPKISLEFKQFLLSNLNNKSTNKVIELNNEILDNEEPDLKSFDESELSKESLLISEGTRTSFLMKFGGVLRKKLSIDQTNFVLNLTNKYICKPSLPYQEFKNVCISLEKYDGFDDKLLAYKILEFLKIVPDNEASEKDVRDHLIGEKKLKINKALTYLIKEQIIIKKGRMFYLIQKASWKEDFMDAGIEINFKFPYFYDYVTIRYGDMIIIGGKSGSGKSHISMNMVKRFVNEGITPYYVTLEAGNRFANIAKQVGLTEGDFKWDCHYNPEHIELEPNAITIIDWILPQDYSKTDKLFEYFSQQLKKCGGLLVIFVQLRKNGLFFAPDLIEFFPSVVAKFLQEEDDNTKGCFEFNKIREPKIRKWHIKIPTIYNWETKELCRVDELENKGGDNEIESCF